MAFKVPHQAGVPHAIIEPELGLYDGLFLLKLGPDLSVGEKLLMVNLGQPRNTTAQGWLYTLAQCPPVVGCSDTMLNMEPSHFPLKLCDTCWFGVVSSVFVDFLDFEPCGQLHFQERVPFVPLVSLQKWIVRRSMPHAPWAA